MAHGGQNGFGVLQSGRTTYSVQTAWGRNDDGDYENEDVFTIGGKIRRDVRHSGGINLNRQSYITNPPNTWHVLNGEARKLPSVASSEAVVFPYSVVGILIDLDAREFKIIEDEMIGNVSTHVIRRIYDNEQEHRMFFDVNSSLLLGTRTTRPGGSIETRYDNYKSVDGFRIPYLIKTFFNGTLVQTMTLTSIELLPSVDEEKFSEPQSDKANN